MGTEDRLDALIDLLGDRSPTVWREVRRQLEGAGRGAAPRLAKVARAGEPRARGRARSLLLGIARERAGRRLVRFAMGASLDLERGLLLLSRLEEPRLDLRGVLARLDAMAAELLRRIEPMPPSIERALELPRYLGGELGFCGDERDYHHPDRIYLHRALERRAGMPLTLCAIHLFVARRAGIHAAMVGLPGHVVLRLYGADTSALVDPFHGGVRIGERECLRYLALHGLSFHPRWFADASDAAMFERQLRNLRSSYVRRGLAREVRLLERVLGTLAARGTGAGGAPGGVGAEGAA